MKSPLHGLLLLSLTAAVTAPAQTGGVFTRSASGQFTVRALRSTLDQPLPPDLVTNLDFIELEPTLLAVASERIRKGLNDELDLTAPWRDKIYLDVLSVRDGAEAVTVVSERFKDGWVYRVSLPRLVARRQFVRALVNTLLLEYANRGATARSAEIPAWLAEGLTQQLLATRESQLMLPPPTLTIKGVSLRPVAVEARKNDPLAGARVNLRNRAPLTVAQLSWPTADQLEGADASVYHHSTQVFVTELLRLKGGPAAMVRMLGQLPTCYNWQTAFQAAFRAHFASPLELEKWWALQVVHLSGRDPNQLWPLDESWRKLGEILQAPVAIRARSDALPIHRTASLQTVIGEWDLLEQRQVLLAKLRELEMARVRLPQEFVPLDDGYRAVLRSYLEQREQSALSLTNPRSLSPAARKAIRDAIRRLDALDQQRQTLRPAGALAGAETSAKIVEKP